MGRTDRFFFAAEFWGFDWVITQWWGLKMGRPTFEPSDAQREVVFTLAQHGVFIEQISRVVGCSAKTLRVRFAEELAAARAIPAGNRADCDAVIAQQAKTTLRRSRAQLVVVCGKCGALLEFEERETSRTSGRTEPR